MHLPIPIAGVYSHQNNDTRAPSNMDRTLRTIIVSSRLALHMCTIFYMNGYDAALYRRLLLFEIHSNRIIRCRCTASENNNIPMYQCVRCRPNAEIMLL